MRMQLGDTAMRSLKTLAPALLAIALTGTLTAQDKAGKADLPMAPAAPAAEAQHDPHRHDDMAVPKTDRKSTRLNSSHPR